MLFYHLLFFVLFLCRLDSLHALQGLVQTQSSSKSSKDLRSLFKLEHSDAVENLSPNRIVSMMPASATTTSNNGNNGPLRQNLFGSPIVSVLYERVLPPLWEAGLRIGGPDAEYREAVRYLGRGGGGVALDLSCGTGFVGRQMARHRDFERVFGLDYSEEMLGECLRSVEREKAGRQGSDNSNPSLIRGDASCLPFEDNVFDAVHWGAAMHCVPDAALALSEVHRVLKPGGRLYATTFLRPFPDVVFRFFTVRELRQLSEDAGFRSGDVSVEKRGVYGIVRATK